MWIELQKDIARPAPDVYAFLVDPSRLSLWVKGLVVHEPLPGPERGVGARFRQELQISGSAYAFDGRITHDEPGRVFGYRLEHAEAALTTRFDLRGLSAGTLVVVTNEAQLKSLRLKFVKGMVERFLREQMALSLDRLAAAIETSG